MKEAMSDEVVLKFIGMKLVSSTIDNPHDFHPLKYLFPAATDKGVTATFLELRSTGYVTKYAVLFRASFRLITMLGDNAFLRARVCADFDPADTTSNDAVALSGQGFHLVPPYIGAQLNFGHQAAGKLVLFKPANTENIRGKFSKLDAAHYRAARLEAFVENKVVDVLHTLFPESIHTDLAPGSIESNIFKTIVKMNIDAVMNAWFNDPSEVMSTLFTRLMYSGLGLIPIPERVAAYVLRMETAPRIEDILPVVHTVEEYRTLSIRDRATLGVTPPDAVTAAAMLAAERVMCPAAAAKTDNRRVNPVTHLNTDMRAKISQLLVSTDVMEKVIAWLQTFTSPRMVNVAIDLILASFDNKDMLKLHDHETSSDEGGADPDNWAT